MKNGNFEQQFNYRAGGLFLSKKETSSKSDFYSRNVFALSFASVNDS